MNVSPPTLLKGSSDEEFNRLYRLAESQGQAFLAVRPERKYATVHYDTGTLLSRHGTPDYVLPESAVDDIREYYEAYLQRRRDHGCSRPAMYGVGPIVGMLRVLKEDALEFASDLGSIIVGGSETASGIASVTRD